MNPPAKIRRFSLRALFLWVVMVVLSFGLFHWAARLESAILCCLGIGGLGLSGLLALIVLQRCWRYTIAVFTLLLAAYVGVYVVLSVNGRYEPGPMGLSRVYFYVWAPAGFVRDNKWSARMMIAFFPLYYMDEQFWHTDQDTNPGGVP